MVIKEEDMMTCEMKEKKSSQAVVRLPLPSLHSALEPAKLCLLPPQFIRYSPWILSLSMTQLASFGMTIVRNLRDYLLHESV